MRRLGVLSLALLLAACSSAEQKPQTTWKVKATTESQMRIWITKADGSLQCAPKGRGTLSPQRAAQELQTAGIIVFQARQGTDGQMRVQKCGAPTGNTVELEISRPDVSRALGYGFVSKTESD